MRKGASGGVQSPRIVGPPGYREGLRPEDDASSPGNVALVRVSFDALTGSEGAAMSERIGRLRSACPQLSVVVGITDFTRMADDGVGLQGVRVLRGDGVILGGRPSLPELRRCLTEPRNALAGLSRWIEQEISHPDVQLCRSLTEAGFVACPSDSMPSELGERWPRSYPGTPRIWYDLGRGLRSVLALQRHPSRTQAELAFLLRFHDGPSLSRHLHGLFGLRPSQITYRLGWRWLLHAWARHHAPAETFSGRHGRKRMSVAKVQELWSRARDGTTFSNDGVSG